MSKIEVSGHGRLAFRGLSCWKASVALYLWLRFLVGAMGHSWAPCLPSFVLLVSFSGSFCGACTPRLPGFILLVSFSGPFYGARAPRLLGFMLLVGFRCVLFFWLWLLAVLWVILQRVVSFGDTLLVVLM